MRSAVHVRSSGSVKIISLDSESVRSRLAEAARELRKRDNNVISVWLFGSLARRDFLPGSDADVLIVLKECGLPFRDRIDRFITAFSDIGIPVDVLPVTEFELQDRADEPFWREVLAERERLA